MEFANPFLFFFDPIYRAPTIGSMLMCLAAGLVGTLVFLRKQSLVGEALSHASYPGVILGVIFTAAFFNVEPDSLVLAFFILLGAFITALLGLRLIQFLMHSLKVPSDAALCFVLSAFFGIGVTLASEVQFSYTNYYRQVAVYLYGQAATMTDTHIYIYASLAIATIGLLFFFYKELQAITFDRQYAKSLGIAVGKIDMLLSILVVLSIIIGIRSVGVVLMSAMLIAPPVAARQFTNQLSLLLALSGIFGIISGFLGNYLSIQSSEYLSQLYPDQRLSIPTGPMIVLVAISIFLVSLLAAPERGLLVRFYRIARFRYQCLCENLLKTMWRVGPEKNIRLSLITQSQPYSRLYLKFILWRMELNGWVRRPDANHYQLTKDGSHRAAKIVRLHRLWELYLASYVGVGSERVHHIAEEMEHILTPEIEEKLTRLLNDPKEDPHQQPIPPKNWL